MADRRKLTPSEKASAERARSFWEKKKRKEKITQADAAAAVNMTPSAFNQYINGVIPLNAKTTATLARYLGLSSPRDIDPDWLHSSLSENAEIDSEFEALIRILDPDQKLEAVRNFAQTLEPGEALSFAKVFLDRVEAGL